MSKFRSTVTVNGVRYESLHDFSKRKSAENAAAQKAYLLLPVYETIQEGPPHMPKFRSIVTVNGVRYDSPHGFDKRKSAENAAAQVALEDIVTKVDGGPIPSPVAMVEASSFMSAATFFSSNVGVCGIEQEDSVRNLSVIVNANSSVDMSCQIYSNITFLVQPPQERCSYFTSHECLLETLLYGLL
eukprot:Gb_03872 [translate_table: standard]